MSDSSTVLWRLDSLELDWIPVCACFLVVLFISAIETHVLMDHTTSSVYGSFVLKVWTKKKYIILKPRGRYFDLMNTLYFILTIHTILQFEWSI